MPIGIPDKVKVAVKGRHVTVEGPKGKLEWDLPPRTEVEQEGTRLTVKRLGNDAEARAMHGLGRAILQNMVKGVSVGFSRRLEIHGVGFKAAVKGSEITLNLGYSHPIVYAIPPLVTIKVEESTKLLIEGPDKQKVGQVASEIRSYYPPEPYKGKGVRYTDERIIRKEGKTVQ